MRPILNTLLSSRFNCFMLGVALSLLALPAPRFILDAWLSKNAQDFELTAEMDAYLAEQTEVAMVNTLLEAIPSYTQAILNRTNIDHAQRVSLELTWLPIMEEFQRTKETALLFKAGVIKDLIDRKILISQRRTNQIDGSTASNDI